MHWLLCEEGRGCEVKVLVCCKTIFLKLQRQRNFALLWKDLSCMQPYSYITNLRKTVFHGKNATNSCHLIGISMLEQTENSYHDTTLHVSI